MKRFIPNNLRQEGTGGLFVAWEAKSGAKNTVKHFLLLGNLIMIMITIMITWTQSFSPSWTLAFGQSEDS